MEVIVFYTCLTVIVIVFHVHLSSDNPPHAH